MVGNPYCNRNMHNIAIESIASNICVNNKLLNTLSLILLCTIMTDDSLFDCRVLPQQGRDGAAGLGTWVGARPLWCQFGTAGVFWKSQ